MHEHVHVSWRILPRSTGRDTVIFYYSCLQFAVGDEEEL